jgi:DNA polymerase I
MERRGIGFNSGLCGDKLQIATSDELTALLHLSQVLGGLGVVWEGDARDIWSSPSQMVRLFHEEKYLGLGHAPVCKKGKVKDGKVSTDGASLEWLALQNPRVSELVAGIIRLKRVRSGIKYLTKLPSHALNGRIHPVTGPASDGDDRVGTITGRLAMKNPEGQQIPRDAKKDPYKLRELFIAGEGCSLVSGDYTALEVVVFAHILKSEFRDSQLAEETAPGAPDFHSVNARRVFGKFLGWTLPGGRKVNECQLADFKQDPEVKYLRDLIKAVWYGLMYGKGAYGFGSSLMGTDGMPIGEAKAQAVVDGLMAGLPSLALYQEGIHKKLARYGEVRSLSGRRCYVKPLLASRKTYGMAYRRSLNFPMQAGAADIMAHALVSVHEAGLPVVLQVHDELILDAPSGADGVRRAETELRAHMLSAGQKMGLVVSLQVSTGTGSNWHECK